MPASRRVSIGIPVTSADDAGSGVLSVVMPAFNEADFLEATVVDVAEGLRTRGRGFEIIVCENGSTDDTAVMARRLAEKYTEVRVEQLDRADYGAALRHGLLHARGDIVVNFDVDYYDLAFLDVAVQELVGSDRPAIVVGSKRSARSHDERPALRKLVTATFAAILRLLFGLRVSDTHGMKALRRSDVVPIARRCRFGQDLFDTELILRAEREGLGIAEIPVVVVERRPARTSVLRRVPRTLLGLIKLRIALWREHA
jgi:glycosyltransferase involved in cell wall biosynthesis